VYTLKYLVPAADTVSGVVDLMVSSCRPCSDLLREVRDIPKSEGGHEEDEIIFRPIAGER
jgi:hypothetical protein